MKKIILILSILLLTCSINAQDFLNSVSMGYDYLYNYPNCANKNAHSVNINIVNIYLGYVGNIAKNTEFRTGEINIGYSIKLKNWGQPYNINCLKTLTSTVYLTPIVGFTYSDPLKIIIKDGHKDYEYYNVFSIGFGLSYRYNKVLFSTQLTNNKLGLSFGYCF